jgi:hypothetical protein
MNSWTSNPSHADDFRTMAGWTLRQHHTGELRFFNTKQTCA